ncbi:ATP-binding protein [Cellulomonas sp. NPDC055163]
MKWSSAPGAPVVPTAPQRQRRNPFRGPRQFDRSDLLPNRRRESEELANLVIANQVVLLHAPSGAGKTSLIEAGVVRELEREGFHVTPRLRVSTPTGLQNGNPYIQSLVGYLLAGSSAPASEATTLLQAVIRWEAEQERPDTGLEPMTVLVIDQLEEVLTCDPTDWSAQEGFFRELGDLLRTRPVWALLSIREDYMGGLDRYLDLVPGFLQTRYRLDFLTHEDAKLAMQVPSREQGVTFHADAAAELGRRLASVEVQQPGKDTVQRTARYVEPFQLQVVCRQLWKKIRKERGDDFPDITLHDVHEYADIDQALTRYYGDTIATVVARTRVDERVLRDWFETELVTKNSIRSQTLEQPATADPSAVLRELEDGYLVRGDVRGGSTWYELTHDRLIRAVQRSNETWRWEKLEPWQIAAHKWNQFDHHPAFLLTPSELPGPSVATTRLTDVERDFLRASNADAQRSALMSRLRSTSRIGYLAAAEAVVILVLVTLLLV